MSAEERWADRQEWAEEKRCGFDFEMNQILFVQESECAEPDCAANGQMVRYQIAPLRNPHRTYVEIDLCANHASEDYAWILFEKQIEL